MEQPTRFESLRFALDTFIDAYEKEGDLTEKESTIVQLIIELGQSWGREQHENAQRRLAEAMHCCPECGRNKHESAVF